MPKPNPRGFRHLFAHCESIAAWLHPYAEVVLHDLASDRIVNIWNNFSRRAPGDESLLAEDIGFEEGIDVYGPYERSNIDGRRLKCVSSVVRDPQGKAIGLMCLNLDVSAFDKLQQLIGAFAMPSAAIPAPLIERDWREQIHQSLGAFLRERGLAISALNRAQKIEAIRALDAQHLFSTRNAAQHVADMLGVSRATIYNWLDAARKETP